MNRLLKFKIFEENQKPLQELSKDVSIPESQYMTDCIEQAIDFDKVKEKYSSEMGISQCPKSVDAILPMQDRFLFIEFKNGCIKKGTEHSKIYMKILDSLLIFCDIVNCTLTNIRQEIDFILVYNEGKNTPHSPSLGNIENAVGKLAGESKIRFGLERFKRMYFHDVLTLTEQEFSQYLKSKLKDC